MKKITAMEIYENNQERILEDCLSDILKNAIFKYMSTSSTSEKKIWGQHIKVAQKAINSLNKKASIENCLLPEL